MNSLKKITGTGFLTLDIILNGSKNTPPKFQAGGSFGNVITILSFLGFEAYPISRLANNKVTELLLGDIVEWGVKTDLVFRDETGSTPVIIHRILKDKEGNPKHKFEFKNPDNGKWLPSYKPFLSKKVKEIENIIPNSDVYYFDRVSRASVDLAKIAKSKGTIVYFEPSSYKNSKLFIEAINTSDIVKFSNERIKNYKHLFPESNASLEIETLGKDGINYRFNSDKWINLKPFLISDPVDTAGAGDWCSSGIIKMICERDHLLTAQSKLEIEQAINYGQALGAINCLFDGARGIMYNIDVDTLEEWISLLMDDRFNFDFLNLKKRINKYTYSDVKEIFESI